MSAAPLPPVPLAFHTSAVHANTLFTFQPEAFQSLDLTPGAQWKQLPMGVAVNGSQAVVAQSQGQDCLFIVGGRSNSSFASFPGFQRYNFASNSWQQLSPETSVAQNRVQHGAVYLQSTGSILIFGGSQDNSYKATSQTYTIRTNEPYTMRSWPAGAPAVQNPILMPYNASHALLAGGGANQNQIWTFSEADGWVMMTTTIPGGVPDASKVKGAVVTGANGQKELELFNMNVSPNTVQNIPLSGQFKRSVAPDSDLVQRQEGAPTAVRNGFDLAQALDKIVLTGGTADKAAGPVVVFDQAAHAWSNAQAVFGSSAGSDPNAAPGVNRASSSPDAPTGNSASAAASPAVSPVASGASGAAAASSAPGAQTSSGAAAGASNSAAGSSSAPAAVTSGAAASGTAAASASGASNASGKAAGSSTGGAAGSATTDAAGAAASTPAGGASADSTTIILAAVLGSFFGIAAIFLIALLIVRYRRNKMRQLQERDAALDEKRAGSPASTVGSINAGKRSPFENGQAPMISKPTPVQMNQAEDLAPPRPLGNDEGWSRYFANNNTVENLYPGTEGAPGAAAHAGAAGHAAPAAGIGAGGAIAAGAAVGAAAGIGAAALAHNHSGARDTQYTAASDYTMDYSPTTSHNPHESALVIPPLGAGANNNYGHSRGFSAGTIPEDSATFLASSAESSQEPWDPTSSKDSARMRPASSVYYDRASSVYPQNPLSPNTMGNFPPVPIRPSTSGGESDRGMRSIVSTDFGAAGNRDTNNTDFSFPESVARRAGPNDEPRSAGNATGRKEGDLSWVQMH